MATTDFTDGVTLTAASWFDDVDRAVYSYLTAVAGTNTITATGSVTATLTAGNIFRFIPAATNTGATTLNITPSGGSALGAKNVFTDGAACIGGEIIINVPIQVMYDGTQFNILGARKSVGAAGTILMSRTAAADKLAYVAALNKAIYGLTYDNGTDATNDLNINVGGAMDATGAYWMTLATALGKQSDVAWAVGGTTGAPAGGLDTGVVGNSDYYIWLIARSDTGVVDALFSLSSTAPTMPANYDFKRLIGWFKRVGGTIVAFTTYETEGGGLELLWTTPTLDVNLANTLTTARRTDAVKVPLNFSVIALLSVVIADPAASDVIVYCPDQSDISPATISNITNAAGISGSASMNIRTSATGTIAARASTATMDVYRVATMGFAWARRN